MSLDFDELTEVNGPSVAAVKDYVIVTEETADEDEDAHPAAGVLREFATTVAAKQSADTAERYYRGLKPLVCWLDRERDIRSPEAASRDDVREYLQWLVGTPWSRNSRESRFAACQRFYAWAAEEGPLDDDLAEDASIDDYTLAAGELEESRRETAEEDDYKWIRRQKVQQLWQEENITAPRARDELLLKMMWYTMCRCRALADARLGDDLDREEGRLKVKNLKKGDNQADYRWVYYPKSRIEPLLQTWLDQGRRDDLGPYGGESDYLFLTHQSEKMRPSHISRKVKQAAFNAGIQEVSGYDVHGNPRWLVTGHTIRHSSATYFANETSVDIHFIQQQLGHSNIDTTMRYVHDDRRARKRAFQQAWE